MKSADVADTVACSGRSFQQSRCPAMAELTKYQQTIVRNYYANLDTALLQRLGERVTDLYLADGKKRTKLWDGIVVSLAKLGVPQSRIDQLRASDDARRLAALVQELHGKE
jgi:hypothetical protein